MKVKGVKEMKAKMDATVRAFARAKINALTRFGTVEMREMKRRTPVDTGELVDSGQVDKPVVSGNRTSILLHFDAPHAMIVHEDLEAFHRVGQAKYFESVLNESERYMLPRIAADIKSEVGL